MVDMVVWGTRQTISFRSTPRSTFTPTFSFQHGGARQRQRYRRTTGQSDRETSLPICRVDFFFLYLYLYVYIYLII